jgi:hypothetical protein
VRAHRVRTNSTFNEERPTSGIDIYDASVKGGKQLVEETVSRRAWLKLWFANNQIIMCGRIDNSLCGAYTFARQWMMRMLIGGQTPPELR